MKRQDSKQKHTKIFFHPNPQTESHHCLSPHQKVEEDFTRIQKKLCFAPEPFPSAHKQNNTDKKNKPSIFPLTNRTFDKPFPYENHSLLRSSTPSSACCRGQRSDDDYHASQYLFLLYFFAGKRSYGMLLTAHPISDVMDPYLLPAIPPIPYRPRLSTSVGRITRQILAITVPQTHHSCIVCLPFSVCMSVCLSAGPLFFAQKAFSTTAG